MRFEGWDVMLFPLNTGSEPSQGPIQEFRVQCDVVPDTEFAHTHASLGTPTVSSFIASLQPGTPFKISIHSWTTPGISRYARAYSRHPELVKIEARVLIDGRLVASCAFNRNRHWPQHIVHTFDVSKNGDLEPLRFPPFRREMLSQERWNPGDDMGRIKVILSEGFPRESASLPIQRVKNIVAFSFQHAPLDVLENVEIAWPNQAMWTRPHLSAPAAPPFYQKDDTHSPRRTEQDASHNANFGINMGSGDMTSALNNLNTIPALDVMPSIPFTTGNDVFADAGLYNAWTYHNSTTTTSQGHNNHDWFSQKPKDTNIDTLMGEFHPPTLQRAQTMQPLSDITASIKRRLSPVDNHYFSQSSPASRAPTSTPIGGAENKDHFPAMASSVLPADLTATLTNSLLNQPLPLSMRSTNRSLPPARPMPSIKPHNDVLARGVCASPARPENTRMAETIDLTDSCMPMSTEPTQVSLALPRMAQDVGDFNSEPSLGTSPCAMRGESSVSPKTDEDLVGTDISLY